MKTAQCKTNRGSGHHSIVNHEKQSFFSGQTHNTESFFSPVPIQPKLKIGSPDDPYERQADRVAEAVVSSPVPAIQQQSMDDEEEMLQMKCSDCEKEENVQMKSVSARTSNTAPHGISQKIQNAFGGNHLPKSVNTEMSQKMGADFSNVNIHTGHEASRLNQSLGARAFTYGNNIFFNSGEYNPESKDGKHLLAHELVHTVQQEKSSKFGIQRICVSNPSSAPSLGILGCTTDTSPIRNPNAEIVFGAVSNTTINPADLTKLSSVASQWHANSRNETIRIDGFSSCDGGTTYNWQLSCSRTNVIENELINPSDGSAGIPSTATFVKVARGETEKFSSSTPDENRRGIVTLQPVPTAAPTAVPSSASTDFQINRVPGSTRSQVFFAKGSSSLTADAIAQIEILKQASPTNVRLIGFASMEEPAPLAQARADAVRTKMATSPNVINVPSSDTIGNAAATSTRIDFARARSVEIIVGSATATTQDCTLREKTPPHNLVNPPTEPCNSIDPNTLSAFNSALTIANNSMNHAMNVINPLHSKYNPILIDRFFGNSNPATLATLSVNMGNLQSHVSSLPAITQCGGQCDTGGCEGGSTIAYNSGVDSSAIMTLCVPVFRSLNINDRARNLIHESAHGTSPLGGPGALTEGTKDVAYRHERMLFHLSSSDRLVNSDSYALFALFAKEIHDTGKATAVPSGISVPASDTITGITGTDKSALELAIAHLEKRLSWASSHSEQLFGEALKVRASTINWVDTWAERYMTKAATLFPVTAPPSAPNLHDMSILAAIIERFKIMKFEIKRDLSINAMYSGIINWPSSGDLASDTLEVGPDFFRATNENQISLLLENLAGSTPDVETAFIPGYVLFAKFIHDNAT